MIKTIKIKRGIDKKNMRWFETKQKSKGKVNKCI